MYVWNSNHNRTHVPGCRAVTDMMKEEHKVPTEEPQGHLCKWCLRIGITDYVESHGLDQYIGDETCTDPDLRNRMKKMGCTCGSHLGDIRMYPHTDGVPIPGRPGLWWVYFKCYSHEHKKSHRRLPETFVNINKLPEQVEVYH